MVKEYRTVEQISSTSILVKEVCGVRCGELAEIVLPHTGDIRHGIVTSVDGDTVRVLVFEGTLKMRRSELKVRFKERGLTVPLSRELLGRSFGCLCDPADAGERIISDKRADACRIFESSERRAVLGGAREKSLSVLDGKSRLSVGQSITLGTQARIDCIYDSISDIIKDCYAECRESEFALVLAIMGAGADSLKARLSAEINDKAVTFVAPIEESPCERILLPRIAMTVADYLAFDQGMDVLVVMLGLNEYGEAYRNICFAEKAAAHGTVYDKQTLLELCDDSLEHELARIFEHVGTGSDDKGSVTLLSAISSCGSIPTLNDTVRRLSNVYVEFSDAPSETNTDV